MNLNFILLGFLANMLELSYRQVTTVTFISSSTVNILKAYQFRVRVSLAVTLALGTE